MSSKNTTMEKKKSVPCRQPQPSPLLRSQRVPHHPNISPILTVGGRKHHAIALEVESFKGGGVRLAKRGCCSCTDLHPISARPRLAFSVSFEDLCLSVGMLCHADCIAVHFISFLPSMILPPTSLPPYLSQNGPPPPPKRKGEKGGSQERIEKKGS